MVTASPRHILITGASSGIGEALALIYAAPGVVLSLSGRDINRLSAVAVACRAHGAIVSDTVIDVVDSAAMTLWIAERDGTGPLDLVIANAGISGGAAGIENEDALAQAQRILATNIDGVLNTVTPAVALMRPRGRGQVAIMSSLAGFRGMGSAAAYGASKAAVRVWGEGLRTVLATTGIGVSVICPGFITSRMTATNRFPMPFLMSAGNAARIIKRGLAANRGRIAFPWTMMALVWALAAMPDRLAGRLTGSLPTKD